MISFNIITTATSMLTAIKETVGSNWDNVSSTAFQFIERNKERLRCIAELRISGDLPDDKFLSRMEDEKLILEAELNALEVISKAIAQQAANAAIDVLVKALK